MVKTIYERIWQHGDVTDYIRYQYEGTDIKQRVGKTTGYDAFKIACEEAGIRDF